MLLALLLQGSTQTPVAVTVGRVTAVAWPSQQGLATSLAEIADHARDFPGIGALPDRPIRIILAPTREKYDSLTRGRLPLWSEGAAFPDASTIVLLTVRPSDRPTVAQSRPISDNSFLVEEAYNQEAGVVQHISAWQRALRSAAWAYTFTQEWPVGTQTHQLSYTIPVQRTESPSRTGLGDAVLNYRYQLRGAAARVAIAPRLSLLLPTGSSARGLGTGHVGAQLNVPVSVALAPSLVSHWNAGVTAVSHTTTYNLGASVIWLAGPTFNALVEVTWADQGGKHDVVVNPGIRWAHNFASGLQIVPGVAFPDGKSVFLYLSFEHRFKPAERP